MTTAQTQSELHSGERFVAPTLEAIEKMDPMHVSRYRYACKRMTEGAVVCDLGCGVGYGAKMLSDAGLKVYGIDKSIETIRYARQHYPGPNYMAMDAVTFLDDAEGKLDAVVCYEMMEHVKNSHRLIHEIHRALRIGTGKLFLSVPTPKVDELIGRNRHHHGAFTSDHLLGVTLHYFDLYRFEHQPRHLGTGQWNEDCGLFAEFVRRTMLG